MRSEKRRFKLSNGNTPRNRTHAAGFRVSRPPGTKRASSHTGLAKSDLVEHDHGDVSFGARARDLDPFALRVDPKRGGRVLHKADNVARLGLQLHLATFDLQSVCVRTRISWNGPGNAVVLVIQKLFARLADRC